MPPQILNIELLNEFISSQVDSVVSLRLKDLQLELELLKKATLTKEVMTLEETAKYMGKSRFTVRELCKKEKLAYYRDGKRLYFKTTDINQFLLKGRVLSADETERAAKLYADYNQTLTTRKRQKAG